ncbi:hypothetical protein BCV70DRAFT_65147 [Testicularia cyperi]|uniref:Uncharacterized protein n=1 Tax=Testicularia cyperi TaxID=1882483 RepID=A0A317XI31_9BASI|nr:hypothetical protein BCV70DRAFT_65147 [Testicularia cyperi]
MTKGAWQGESQSSIAFSMNPRDSRVVSIYDKYLYDPKDLESSDPRRRELARKASQAKLHGRPANNMDANGIRPMGANQSSSAYPQQRKSIAFGHGTKTADGHTASSTLGGLGHNGNTSHSHGISPSASSRDSGAFGLGLGMLGGGDTDSDSDSDNDLPRSKKNPGLDRLTKTETPHRPESWTDRAAAVGQRPPDSASQNPPSLKMMALKSAKHGGSIPSAPGADQRGLSAHREPVDRTSRHGSTIGFGGGMSDDGESARASHNPTRPEEKRLSARTALTKQLGLASPLAGPATYKGADSGPQHEHASHQQSPARQHYDDRAGSSMGRGSPPRNVIPPPIDVNRAEGRRDPFGDQTNAQGMPVPSPAGSNFTHGSHPQSAGPMRSPGYGPSGMPSPQYGPGPGSAGMGPPPNVLQRGPPSPLGPGPAAERGPGSAGIPASLQAGSGPRGPPQGAMTNGPSSRGPPGPGSAPLSGRGPPGSSHGNFGPSFSDAPGPGKRQSIFRRSMALFGGGPGLSQDTSGRGEHYHAGPQSRQGAPPQKRQSLFRRSMALFGGNSGPSMPTPQPARMAGPPQPPPAPVPRVQGLKADYEKPDHPRKSQFLGAGGEGAEWDTQGEGAKFWRRFSMAQKNAHTQKLEAGSREWMASMATGKRKLIIISVLGLTALVGIIVGVIVWREIVAPSGKDSSDMPSSVYKANLGAQDNPSGATLTTTTSSSSHKAKSTSSSSYSSRSLTERSPVDQIREDTYHHSRRRLAQDGINAPRLRKRAFGKPPTVLPAGSLANVD